VGDVADVGLSWSRPTRTALKALAVTRHEGRWSSGWKHHPATQRLAARQLRQAVHATRPDVVLQIGDLARLEAPYLVYQDLSFDLLRDVFGEGEIPHFPHLSCAKLARLRDRQHAIYDGAEGVLAMSAWLVEHLVRVTGLPKEKVHYVPPACNVVPPELPRPPDPDRPRRRLLFVGKDFSTKAGPEVVAALALLRRDIDPAMELTVVGPTVWPMPGPPPEGVRFVGRLPVSRVSPLFTEHDLFVMPSHFEGFGMVFVEALAHGLPCVGRDVCAMPELIRPGDNGGLVGSDDPGELADLIARLLADDELRSRTVSQAPDVIARYAWSRAAEDVLRIAAKAR
jgi:glycosyltransferase involved in cell wall biosynthesis